MTLERKSLTYCSAMLLTCISLYFKLTDSPLKTISRFRPVHQLFITYKKFESSQWSRYTEYIIGAMTSTLTSWTHDPEGLLSHNRFTPNCSTYCCIGHMFWIEFLELFYVELVI